LPESKLEIYRSCVGTLTEKWDAAGKRLEMPTEYNLVRDKKGAFAHVAYWMYKQLSSGPDSLARLKYPTIESELTRCLCEREFKGRESEADQAARCFLDYAAKRSIFVKDRFVHKTFHEYFAALYLYRNFCVGHTADEVFLEIDPYLPSDYWAVVLELLFQMIDEQSGQLLDAILAKVTAKAQESAPERLTLLPLPLRLLGELQNVGTSTAESLVSLGVRACSSINVPDLWIDEGTPGRLEIYTRPDEAPHQIVAGTLAHLPVKFQPLRVKHAREAARNAAGNVDMLLPVAALCVENQPAFARLEEVIPDWPTVCDDLAKRHLGIFYHLNPLKDIAQQADRFVRLIGEDRLFHSCRLVFERVSYASFVDSIMYRLKAETEKEGFRNKCWTSRA
jgi:hypothetical protein